MPVTDVRKDTDTLKMTVDARYDAPVERVWQLWADPRQLERWWGPPTYPATVESHDLTPGGRVTYAMTSPEGERYPGYWDVLDVDPPHRFEIRDGFAEQDGTPSDSMPRVEMAVQLEADDAGGTQMQLVSTFPSAEAMQQLVEMGMEEGLVSAMGQIEPLLEERPATG